MHYRICYYLRNKNLSSFQSGFRENHSTNWALLCVTEVYAVDQRKSTFLILCDFSKAFDHAYHCFLLIKWIQLGLSSFSVAWFDFYLTGRYQRITFWYYILIDSLVGNVLVGVATGFCIGAIIIVYSILH